MALIDAAYAYIAENFKVFPVQLDKKPFKDTHGLKDATMTQLGVKELWSKYPNGSIALVTDGYVVIDFDVKTGGIESKKKIEDKYGKMPPTRTHRTGGGGLHYIYRNPNGTDIRNTTAFGGYPGVDLRANGGYIVAPPSPHESGRKYEVLDNSPINPCPDWILEIIKKGVRREGNGEVGGGTIGGDYKGGEQGGGLPIISGQRNQTLARMAGSMRRQGMAQESIETALLATNKNQCNPPLSESEVLTIARSISRYAPKIATEQTEQTVNTEQIGETAQTLNKLNQTEQNCTNTEQLNKLEQTGKYIWRLIDDWYPQHLDEQFDLETVCRQLDLKTREERQHASKKLNYDNGKKLEKSGRLYRYTNITIVPIPWWESGKEDYVAIRFPSNHQKDDLSYFSFQDSVRLSPASVIVVAGQTNAGKSCFARNLVWDNMDKFKVRYMVSQTSGPAFARYANSMTWADPMKDSKSPKFDLIERYEDFQDLMLPDALNIVDWLDADKIEAWKIGLLIKQMQLKLKTGLLVVMIQKNAEAAWGSGGQKSAKWADLYLTMDYNKEKSFTRLEIAKAKEWIGNHDPNGKIYGLEIINYGSQFANIREVRRCGSCGGIGKKSNGECAMCAGVGYLDGMRVTNRPKQPNFTEPEEKNEPF